MNAAVADAKKPADKPAPAPAAAKTKDPVFGEDPPTKESKVGPGGKSTKSPGELFEATKEEKAAEQRRIHDKRIGVIIGAKGLASLRTFGYDVVHVQDAPLSSGVAHRGLD